MPLGIDLGTLSVDDLHIGAELGGVDSHWKVSGTGLVTADGTPSRVKLDMTRTDGPAAHLSADLGFSLDRFSVDGQITAEKSSKGGVVAALIGRPDLDGMSLKLTAKGDRTDGKADLTAAAGDAVTSNGSVRWHRDGAAMAISLQLSAVGPGLPDSPIARMLRAPATLTGEATFDDAGLLMVKQAALKVGPAQLDATARYDTAADKLEATANLQAVEAGPLSDLAGGVKWRNLKLDVQAAASGLATKPQATATLKGSADDVALPMLGERAPPPGRVDLSAKLGLDANGRLVVESFDATTPLAALKGGGGFMPSTQAADGKVTIDLANLSAFSVLAGMKLGGKGHLELTARSDKDGQKVDWQGMLEQLALEDMPPGLLQRDDQAERGARPAGRRGVAARQGRDGEPGLHLRDVGQRPPADGPDRHDARAAQARPAAGGCRRRGIGQGQGGADADRRRPAVLRRPDRSQPGRDLIEETGAGARHHARRPGGARPAQGRRRSRQPAR